MACFPSFKALRFLTKLTDQPLEALLKTLLLRDDFILRFLDIALIFWRIGALKLEFGLRTPNPCSDVGSLDRADAADLLHVAPPCVERSSETVGRELGNITRTNLGDARAPDR
ncbi:hypothetical protein GGI1_04834, partial [Acidithiobacillus sp. GGI-221]